MQDAHGVEKLQPMRIRLCLDLALGIMVVALWFSRGAVHVEVDIPEAQT